MSKVWHWIVAVVAVVPVTGWALFNWLSERHRRVVAEKQLDQEIAARVESEKARADIHEAYHQDLAKLVKVREHIHKAGDKELVDLWDSTFGDNQ